MAQVLSPAPSNNEIFQRARNFRADIEKRGLILPWTEVHPAYLLDLSMGPIAVQRDPRTLLEVIKIARQFAKSSDFGEHLSILQLVMHINDLEEPRIQTFHPYEVRAAENSTFWISVRDYLATHKFLNLGSVLK